MLRDKGLLPADAPNLLEPIYPVGVTGYAKAIGFRPPELVDRMD